MNFQEFYTKTENRLTDAVLSLWATGDKEMQDYFKYLLTQEPIIADAVFQNDPRFLPLCIEPSTGASY